MNILHVLPQGEIGGAERVVADWIRHSRHRNVAIVGGAGPLAAVLRALGCTVHTLAPWRPRSVWSRLPEAAALVEREHIDVIHACLYDGHLLGGLLGRRTRRPALWFNHGPIERVAWSRFARFIPADALVVASTHMQRQMRGSRYWAKQLLVQPLGVDCARFRFDPVRRAAMRAQWGLGDELCVAMLARFDPLKGHALLLHAVAALRRRRPHLSFKLVVAGGALPYAEAVACATEAREWVGRLGLSDTVRFLGSLPDVRDCLQATDILVQTTLIPESFGLALVEGMAMERVVLAPAEGGPAETIRHGIDGFLFAPRDAEALARQLEETMDLARQAPGRFAAVGASARARVEANYRIERSVRDLELLYQRLART